MQISGNITSANKARKVRAAHKARDIKDAMIERVSAPKPKLPALVGGEEIAAHWEAALIERLAHNPTEPGMYAVGRLIGFRVNDPQADDHGEFRALEAVLCRFPRSVANASRREVARVKRQLAGFTPVFEADAIAALAGFGK